MTPFHILSLNTGQVWFWRHAKHILHITKNTHQIIHNNGATDKIHVICFVCSSFDKFRSQNCQFRQLFVMCKGISKSLQLSFLYVVLMFSLCMCRFPQLLQVPSIVQNHAWLAWPECDWSQSVGMSSMCMCVTPDPYRVYTCQQSPVTLVRHKAGEMKNRWIWPEAAAWEPRAVPTDRQVFGSQHPSLYTWTAHCMGTRHRCFSRSTPWVDTALQQKREKYQYPLK